MVQKQKREYRIDRLGAREGEMVERRELEVVLYTGGADAKHWE